MGGSSSSSKVYQESETYVTNKSDIDVLNQTINTTIVNTVIENVKKCSASIIQNQKIEIIGLVAGEDINITSQQVQQGMLDFSCAQTDKIQNEVVNKMVTEIMNQMQTNVDTTVLEKLDAIASSKSTDEWGSFPWGGSESDSDVEQKIKTKIKTDLKKDIKNIVENSVMANFTNKNYNECLSRVVNSQEFLAKDLTAGKNITLTLEQDQAAQIFTRCIQDSDIANKVSTTITDFLGVAIKEDTSTTRMLLASADATAESLSGGFFEGIGRGIGNIFKGLLPLDIFEGAPSILGLLTTSSLSCCCCLILIILLSVITALF